MYAGRPAPQKESHDCSQRKMENCWNESSDSSGRRRRGSGGSDSWRMSFLLLGAAAKKLFCSADDGDELRNGGLLLLSAPAAMHFDPHVQVNEGRRSNDQLESEAVSAFVS